MLYEQMKTVAKNMDCQIEPLDIKISIKDLFKNHGEHDQATITESHGVFIDKGNLNA